MCRFIESIKVEDQQVFLLDLHQSRVNSTFSHFGKEGSIDLEKIFSKLNHDDDGLYKLKIVYALDKTYTIQMIPYAIPKIKNFELVENNTLVYDFKYEDRTTLELPKKELNAEEVIFVRNGHITDTSFSNLLFKKGGEWYTPSEFLLNGVQRQHLLKKKKIKEAEITLDNVSEFSHFQIINALNDFDDMFIYPVSKIINLPAKK